MYILVCFSSHVVSRLGVGTSMTSYFYKEGGGGGAGSQKHVFFNSYHSVLHLQAMASTEDKAYEIMRELDVDYVLVIFGGLTGYSSDGMCHKQELEMQIEFKYLLYFQVEEKYLPKGSTECYANSALRV